MKVVIATMLALSIMQTINAQTTSSPYSVFGPGELQAKGSGKIKGMAGTGIALKSEHYLNNLNPASYTGIDSMNFIYELGFNSRYSVFESQNKERHTFNFNYNFIGMGFRINRNWASSMGIVPFSSVGYDIQTTKFIEGVNETFNSVYTGNGGINQAYWGNAFRLAKNLSVGLHTSFLFGSLSQEENIWHSAFPYSINIVRTDYLHSFFVDFGLQYTLKTGGFQYHLGAIYNPRQSLASRHKVEVLDEGYNSIQSDEYNSGDLVVPEKAGIGLSIQKSNALVFSADYQLQRWSEVRYPIQKQKFSDSHCLSLGVETLPWGTSLSRQWYKRLVYRAGASYKSSYLNLGNQNISDKGFTLGLGIPIRRDGSLLNFAVEAGSGGTTSKGLIRENYLLFHVNFSINELWFQRNKYY